jgi:hypothetical protein
MARPQITLEMLTDQEEILRTLVESQRCRTIVGVVSPVFGRVTVMTCVESIILDDRPLIIFMPFDIHGCILPQNKINLEHIKAVQPFSSEYRNPIETRLVDGQGDQSGLLTTTPL